MTKQDSNSQQPYKPDYRLLSAFTEATELEGEGLRGLCPSYVELSEANTRYQDHELLGQGAVKDVYRAFNNHTKRWVAMARLRADRGPEFYDLFVHEAWLTASLDHPNIITVHDAGIDKDGRPFFTMDLKGKSTLADRAVGSNPADRHELLDVFMKVCDAVAYAHSRGVIHLDLKPDNIQANEFGEVLVCDWGLGKMDGEMEEGEDEMPKALRPLDNMTLMGQIKGSLGYMAPEQVIPGSEKDTRSDIFALGCILHLILTGQPPFKGSIEEVVELTKRADMGSLRKNYPERDIPGALEAVVLKAMAVNPADRYDSVVALRQEISKFLGGFSTLAEKPGFFREARLFVARNRLPVTISLSAIVAISVLSVLSVQGIRRQRERAALFEIKAETVETLYQDELERSAAQRIELAHNLASNASNLKKLGIYFLPLETVREARKLVASAFALNADSPNAKLQRFSLDCITLDFKSALEAPVYQQSRLFDYLLLAEAFPEFNFSEQHRPSVAQLTDFLERAYELNPNRQALIERIVAYDRAARNTDEDYSSVVGALLAFVNGSTVDGAIELQFQSEESVLYLSSNESIRLAIWNEWASNECLLRFMPVRSLKAEVEGRLYLGDLQGLQVETLDLSDCQSLVLNDQVDLPLLRRVVIRSGQIDPARLRRSIQSNERFEIAETP
ncbi:serine/threonine protein kinase [Planctomycetota bacterium]